MPNPTVNPRAAGMWARRRSWFAATVCLTVVSLGIGLGTALGQDAGQSGQAQPGPGMGHMGRHGMPTIDDQIKHLTRKLNLSADQQAKVKPILEDQRNQMEQIRSDSSMSREDRFSKMQSIHESANSQIKGVLNEDQQKKFDEMQKEQRDRMRGGSGGEKSGPPNGGDQPK
jgi:protein CpxP